MLPRELTSSVFLVEVSSVFLVSSSQFCFLTAWAAHIKRHVMAYCPGRQMMYDVLGVGKGKRASMNLV